MLESMNLPQGSALEKAIIYSLNQRKNLEAFLLDGRLELTNNRAKRGVKPFVIAIENPFLSCFVPLRVAKRSRHK